MIRSVTIIGAGNIAVHLVRKLKQMELQKLTVYGRKADVSGYQKDIQPFLSNDPNTLEKKSDLVIIAVNDDNISMVAGQIKDYGQIIVHTSGSTSINVLEQFRHFGVMYPLQTFSVDRDLDWDKIPLFIEASDDYTRENISKFANAFTESIHYKDSEERKKLHISAVFVSNFVNHMVVQGKELADSQGVDFSLLMPLIYETVNKSFSMDPLKAQTGPALRNDIVTLEKHFEALKKYPDKLKLYKILSESILKKGKNNINEKL
ncbi:MAG: DUF2520 domain-containing protein [Bacteroidales bacterium]|nr:DUF2520 domain-containing protein [Bacteroidales bacterium]